MKVAVIGVPMDLGGRRRGTDMGPSAIRYAGLGNVLRGLGHEDVLDMGDIPVAVRETRDVGDERVKYLHDIVSICEQLARRVEEAVRAGRIPVVLGGDHSIAMGTVGGLARVRPELGIIWMDAHGDFNTPESTPSGSIHGMPLAAILGRGHELMTRCCGGPTPKVPEKYTVLVGVRALDPGEREALRHSEVTVFTMKHVDEIGIGAVMRQAAGIAGDGGRRMIHLSVDMDVIDPTYAPGVGTLEPGGLTYREAHLAMEVLAEAGLGSLEFTEVNPILDQGNRTALLIVGLIASALGKKIL